MLEITLARKQDVLLHRLPAQIQEAVAKARLLRIVALGVDLERQEIGRRLDHQLVRDQLDLAGRELRIDGLGAPRDHVPRHGQHALQAHAFGRAEERPLGLEHDLGDAVVIAQIDEQQLAVVALAVHPAREAHLLADLRGAKLAAVVGAIGMHARPRAPRSRPAPAGRRAVKVMSRRPLSRRQRPRGRGVHRPPEAQLARASA